MLTFQLVEALKYAVLSRVAPEVDFGNDCAMLLGAGCAPQSSRCLAGCWIRRSLPQSMRPQASEMSVAERPSRNMVADLANHGRETEGQNAHISDDHSGRTL